MENSFQTSFIPKKPMNAPTTVDKTPTSLLSILSILLLVVMSALSAGLYFYKAYLQGQENTLAAQLSTISGSFDQNTIDELELFDKRTNVSKQLLAAHVVMSPLFSLLGDLTIPSIQYTQFSQTQDDSGFSVKLSGTAHDYKSIALQADAFNSPKGQQLKNVVFSNITRDTDGNVLFDVDFTVDPSLLSYKNDVAAGASDTSAALTQAQTTPNDGTSTPATTPAPATNATTTSPITPVVPPTTTTTPATTQGAPLVPPKNTTNNVPGPNGTPVQAPQ